MPELKRVKDRATSHHSLMAVCWICALSTSALAQTLPPITAAAFLPNGNQVLIGSQAGLKVLNWPDLSIVQELPTQLAHIHDLHVSPQGDEFVAVGGSPAESGSIEWYDAGNYALIASTSLSEDVLYCASYSAGISDRLAVAGGDRNIYVLNGARELAQTWTNHSHPILALRYLMEGGALTSGGLDQGLRVWNGETGQVVRTLANHTAPIVGLAVRPARETLPHPYIVSIGEDRTVRIWQPTLGRLVRFVRLSAIPQSVDWTGDGARVVVGCRDGVVRVIDPDSIAVTHEFPALDGRIDTLQCHPTRNEVLAAGTNGQIIRVQLTRE